MSKEIWKNIPKTNQMYQISNLGRVKSLKFEGERILKEDPNSQGYPRMTVMLEDGTKYRFFIHRMVYHVFKGVKIGNKVIHHSNENRKDYMFKNLKIKDRSKHISEHQKGHTKNIGPRYPITLMKGKKVIDTFPSQRAVAEYLKVSSTTVSMCLKRKFKTIANGYSVRA